VLNQIQPDAITIKKFKSLSEFAETIATLLGPAIARAHA
jgi:hypothetical protein